MNRWSKVIQCVYSRVCSNSYHKKIEIIKAERRAKDQDTKIFLWIINIKFEIKIEIQYSYEFLNKVQLTGMKFYWLYIPIKLGFSPQFFKHFIVFWYFVSKFYVFYIYLLLLWLKSYPDSKCESNTSSGDSN